VSGMIWPVRASPDFASFIHHSVLFVRNEESRLTFFRSTRQWANGARSSSTAATRPDAHSTSCRMDCSAGRWRRPGLWNPGVQLQGDTPFVAPSFLEWTDTTTTGAHRRLAAGPQAQGDRPLLAACYRTGSRELRPFHDQHAGLVPEADSAVHCCVEGGPVEQMSAILQAEGCLGKEAVINLHMIEPWARRNG